MINLREMVRGIKERALAKKAYELMFTFCPGDLENLGYTFIRGELKASRYFAGDKAEYEGFRKAWGKNHNERLPEYF